MSLTPQDNSRASFAQAQQQQQQQTGGGRQIIFQTQNGVPSPSPSQQQRAYPNPIIRTGHNIHAQQQQHQQQQQHKSPYNTPYTQQNNIGLNISNGVPRQNGPVSAEQQIAQGVLSATPLLVGNGNNNTPQRRPPALGKTIHMPPHGTPQHQSMSVNHAINPISQAQRQAQNGSPAVQNMILGPQQQQQRQAMHTMSANLVPSSVSPVSGSQDMSMIDPQLAVDQQLAQGSVDMMNQQQLPENPEVVQGAMLSAPPGGSFPTFEALFAFAQAHALAHGYAFVIGRSKRDNRGLKKVFLICDRGGTNKEKVAGEQRQRKTKSRKCGCEFGVFGLENKTAWLLRGRIDGEHLTHNHPPSESPTEHPGARKLDPKAIAAVKALEENGVSVKETLEILHRENPSVKYLPRDIYNARAAIKRDPSRVEATAMEELPTFYKKPPLTFEEKLRAELRIEVANAQAETEKVKEQWTKEVAELKEQLRNKDKQIRKFEQFIDICNDRVMARREELDGVE